MFLMANEYSITNRWTVGIREENPEYFISFQNSPVEKIGREHENEPS